MYTNTLLLVPQSHVERWCNAGLGLCCIVIHRHGNLCLPPCLGRWRFESLEDLTAHSELLCSDPADLAVAIAIYAMLTEDRPSRMRWELLFEHRHVIGACTLQLKQGSKYPFCLEPNYQIFINRCFLMLGTALGVWRCGLSTN